MIEMNRDLVIRAFNLRQMRKPHELDQLIALLPEKTRMVEVGTFSGSSAVQFLDSPKVEHLTCVDIWCSNYDATDHASNSDMEAAKHAFIIRAGKELYSGRCALLELPSVQAAATYPDHTFDLVYIDAMHHYRAVKEDIQAWLPKVKPGAWIAGHDYLSHHPGVKEAVDELFGKPEHVLFDTSWAVRVK